MPNLKTALKDKDTGFLLITSEFWGLENIAENSETLPANLIKAMTNRNQFIEMTEALPPQVKKAFDSLIKNNGKIPWVEFCRRHGELREMGQAKLEREKAYRTPISTTEWLWYRGLLFKAFFDEGMGLLEYAYLPEEFMAMVIYKSSDPDLETYGKPKKALKIKQVLLANDQIIDHSCTLLAALRMSLKLDEFCKFNIPVNLLAELLKAVGVLDILRQPITDQTRTFLENTRTQALMQLFNSWKMSENLNELWLIPELKCEGKWKNKPLASRQVILKILKDIPPGQWLDLQAFITSIHEHLPDFLRPSGDYDSWLIRNRASGEYLRGFANWNKVEGQLIRCYITNWLHWLGLIDLASEEKDEQYTAFRLTELAKYLFNNQPIRGYREETEKITFRSKSILFCPRLSPRAIRYQIARFCEWGEQKEDGYFYSLSPAALKRAEAQELQVSQLVTLLKKSAKLPIPPSILQALQRWDQFHLQVNFENSIILRVTETTILDQLEKSRAKRFILERISPTIILIKPGGENVVQQTITDLGYLCQIPPSL
jgi:hypothetical protein